MNGTTLEDLLRMTVPAKNKDGEAIQITPEFRVAVQRIGRGVHFIIHPMGHSGETLDFIATGDYLAHLNSGLEPK